MTQIDPRKAPDPEEPETFDKDKFLSDVESGFALPEDASAVTLDPCEWVWPQWGWGGTSLSH